MNKFHLQSCISTDHQPEDVQDVKNFKNWRKILKHFAYNLLNLEFCLTKWIFLKGLSFLFNYT
jgi:hypothetical protein